MPSWNIEDQSEPEEEIFLDIEIIDTGEGISKERQGLLFIPFLELK